jgi:hypothetical protein
MRIYQTVEPVPSRVIGLLRVLRMYGKQGVTRDTLLELLQPLSVREKLDADTIGTNTLLAIRQLSSEETPLIFEREDDRGDPRISLAQDLIRIPSDRFENQIRELLEKSAFRITIDGTQNQFAEACAWLLWQTPNAMPQGHAALKTRMQSNGLSYETLGLSNDARWDVLIYWATYFGLLWQYQEEKCCGLVPDPTTLLSRHIDDLLPRKGHVAIHEFKAGLGKICSALDGGIVHSNVGAVLEEKGAIPRDYRNRLSPALSLALRNLKDIGVLRYWCPDDQRSFQLMSQDEKVAFIERSS